MIAMEECGSRIATRVPDAPADQWDTATCIQYHERLPAPIGTIHDSGDGTRWVELDGFEDPATVTDEMVERAAQAVHAQIWPQELWDNMPEQYQVDILTQERRALEAALSTEMGKP